MIPQKNQCDTELQGDLFRVELIDLVDKRHPLVLLAGQIDWDDFDEAFKPLYCPDNGRCGIPTRLMVGLHYMKHTHDLSDEDTVARWVENPYRQYLRGSKWFEYDLPVDPSSMTNWRKKIGEAGAEEMLAGTIKAGLKSGVIKKSSFKKVNVDTTVQEKAVAFPTDAKLYNRMREKLVKAAKENDVTLRQSYARLGKRALLMASRYMHARQAKRAKRSLRKWLKRRSAIEPLIGHMKTDGKLGRNHLAGIEGDKVNAVLCGCGRNLRKLLSAFSFLPIFSRLLPAFNQVNYLIRGLFRDILSRLNLINQPTFALQ